MAKNSVRVKRSKTSSIPFNIEIELDPDAEPDEPADVLDEAADQFPSMEPPTADPDKREDDKPEPPTSFEVNGRIYQFVENVVEPDGTEIARYWFRAKARVPGILLLNLVGSGVHEDNSYSAAAVGHFMEQALDKRDRTRFDDLLKQEDSPIDMDSLNDVIKFLVEQYSPRPTERPAR